MEYCGGYGGGGSAFIELRRSIDVAAKLLYPLKSAQVDTRTISLASFVALAELIFMRRDAVSFGVRPSFVGDAVGVVEFSSTWIRFDL